VSSLELQKAVVARLKADAGVTALVGQRIYDRVPPDAVFPSVSLGPEQTAPSRADCYDGREITFQVDVWSRAVGFPEVKRIAEAVRAALQDAPLSLTGHRLLDITFTEARTFRDPDGLTSHSAMTFQAITEPV
jgi:hypothetical protein